MRQANSSYLILPRSETFKEWRHRKIREYHIAARNFANPVRSHRTGPRLNGAEGLRYHDDFILYLGDRIYDVLQEFIGHPFDLKAVINAIQQTLLSIERIQGLRLETNIFILINSGARSLEVKFGERGDLENLCGDLRHIKVVQVELPYERRKKILELPNGLPPIGGVPWRG